MFLMLLKFTCTNQGPSTHPGYHQAAGLSHRFTSRPSQGPSATPPDLHVKEQKNHI